jgi:hypothetical protein
MVGDLFSIRVPEMLPRFPRTSAVGDWVMWILQLDPEC